MNNLPALLMKIHLAWFLLMPLAAICGIVMLTDYPWVSYSIAWIPSVVFITIVFKFYRISKKPLKALLVVLLVPAGVGLHLSFFEGNIWLFFIEDAFVETVSLSTSLAIAMFIYRPSGWAGAFVGLGIAAAAIAGFGPPVLNHYLENEGVGWWTALFALLGGGIWTHLRFVMPFAASKRQNSQTQGPGFAENSVLVFLLGEDRDFISPEIGYDEFRHILAFLILWFIVPLLLGTIIKPLIMY